MVKFIYRYLHVKDVCAVLVEKKHLLKICIMCPILGEKNILQAQYQIVNNYFS